MELTKTKFKKTEIGLIPEDWDVLPFGEVVKYTKGFAFKSVDYRKDGVRIIRVSDTTFDDIKLENGIYIEESRACEFLKWKLEEGDLIFSTVGSKPPMYDSMVGKVIYVRKKFEGSLLNQNAVLIRALEKTRDKQYLLLCNFRTKRYLQYIEKIYRGNANQASITLKELFDFKISLPPTHTEQKAIATALGDVDEMIAKLEKLIEKKKAIKQGAMQQLLTPPHKGGKRLEGFSGEWVECQLSDILTFGSGMDYKHLEKGEIPVYGTGGIMTHVKGFLYDGESVGIGRKGTIDQPVLLKGKFWTVDTLFYTHSFQNCTPLFIYYLFLLIPWKEYNEASGVPSLNKNTLGKIKVVIPKAIVEQHAIAQVLSTIEDDIKQLENQRNKIAKIKQGMMHELLTGRTRLV